MAGSGSHPRLCVSSASGPNRSKVRDVPTVRVGFCDSATSERENPQSKPRSAARPRPSASWLPVRRAERTRPHDSESVRRRGRVARHAHDPAHKAEQAARVGFSALPIADGSGTPCSTSPGLARGLPACRRSSMPLSRGATSGTCGATTLQRSTRFSRRRPRSSSSHSSLRVSTGCSTSWHRIVRRRICDQGQRCDHLVRVRVLQLHHLVDHRVR